MKTKSLLIIVLILPSVFWSMNLFGYPDYAPELQNAAWEIRQQANPIAFSALQAGKLSSTVTVYRDLIATK